MFFEFHLLLLSLLTPTVNMNSIHIFKPDFKPTKAGAEKNPDSLGGIGGGRDSVSWGAQLSVHVKIHLPTLGAFGIYIEDSSDTQGESSLNIEEKSR